MESSSAPPTEPRLGADRDSRGDDGEAALRLRLLERRMRLMFIALIVCIVLIGGLGTVTGVLLANHATLLAKQAAEEQVQLHLLQQLQKDFNDFEVEMPQNRLEAYSELREQMNQLRGIYEPLAEFDMTDPQGSLDRILGEGGGGGYDRGPQTPIAPPRTPPPSDDDHDSSGGETSSDSDIDGDGDGGA